MAFPLADGYHLLPKGKMAAVVTWLEMHAPPPPGPALPPAVELVAQPSPDAAVYLALFRAIGEPWLWFGRLQLPGEELQRQLTSEGVEVFFLLHRGETQEEEAIGLLELNREASGAVEIAYFGLLPQWAGRGLGTAFMAAALELAWKPDTRRVWLHTCTFDHPGALRFYRKCGFQPYQRGLEIFDDPRLRGLLDRGAAPDTPLL